MSIPLRAGSLAFVSGCDSARRIKPIRTHNCHAHPTLRRLCHAQSVGCTNACATLLIRIIDRMDGHTYVHKYQWNPITRSLSLFVRCIEPDNSYTKIDTKLTSMNLVARHASNPYGNAFCKRSKESTEILTTPTSKSDERLVSVVCVCVRRVRFSVSSVRSSANSIMH